MKRIKGRDGVTRDVRDDYIIQDGESFTVPLMMMDSAKGTLIHDGNGNPAGSRPGYLVRDDDVAHAVRETVYRQYADTISGRWQSGRWQDRKPAPSAPMTFDGSAAARDGAYAQYRSDIENRWRR